MDHPLGAPSIRFALPAQVTSADIDPRSLQLTAVAADTSLSCPADSSGLTMDGWDLVIDRDALVSSALGICAIPGLSFDVHLKGQGGVTSLDLSLQMDFLSSPTTAPLDIPLSLISSCETDTYWLEPADAPPGAVLELVASPGFFDARSLSAGITDATGAVVSPSIGWPNAVVSSDGSRLTVPTPSDLPARSLFMNLQFVSNGWFVEHLGVELAPISDPVSAYVTAVYLSLLQRHPDPQGDMTWSTALRRGCPTSRWPMRSRRPTSTGRG